MFSSVMPGMILGALSAGISMAMGASFLAALGIYSLATSVAVLALVWLASVLSERRAPHGTAQLHVLQPELVRKG